MSGYVANPFIPRRRATREVRVGDIGVGGDNPLRVQSMTTTPTLDTEATVAQIERLAAAGCEIARVTAPSIRDAENLAAIQQELRSRGVKIPLVADIHYTPNAAMIAAEHVEKVRVNPGNYADKKKFEVREYSDAEYAEEVDRVSERFRPLVLRCKELGRALRIGTNHGSLADRIMNRYGDTPAGMVESALEFLDVCEQERFFNVVFSMKASNPQVAIHAYRLLAARLAQRAPDAPSYPFHVGVTEAGDGEDGRIKSAIGIGALLEDGIGDTIRVSLTEDPVKEVPVARALAERYDVLWSKSTGSQPRDPGADFCADPYAHERRSTRCIPCGGVELGGEAPVRAELELGAPPDDGESAAASLRLSLQSVASLACEGVLVDVSDAQAASRFHEFASSLAKGGAIPVSVRAPVTLIDKLPLAARWVIVASGSVPDADLARAASAAKAVSVPVEWTLCGEPSEVQAGLLRVLEASRSADLDSWLVSVGSSLPVHAIRLVAAELAAHGASDVPLVLRHHSDPKRSDEAALLTAAIELGAPLCDGIGDVVSLGGYGDGARSLSVLYRILQGARLRTTWTEYISCPSCGRTLFDLEEVTERIKQRTQHLKGVKIAVMGCIVNGPGEMADADFGYVGSGPARVNLYVGKELVERNVPEDEAPDRLVELIRKHGAWVAPH